MSVESDFRALLAAHAGLTALVATRIGQNAIGDGEGMPAVVFGVSHVPVYSVDALLDDRATISVQAWAETATEADAVADAVMDAVAGAPATHAARLLDRTTTYDSDFGLDGVLLSVDWWAS